MAAASWPLVGREREIEAVRAAVASGRGAVVFGEAGVGKTRLVDDALPKRGRVVETIATTEAASGIPLGAFAHALGGAGTGAALHDLIGNAARIVEDRVGDGVLFVDDAHHLDPASLTLVSQLVTRAGMTVVATVRTPPDPPPEIVSLWKDAGLERIDVGVLDRDHTAVLARAVLGEDVEPPILDRLWKLSRGNVLFLRELVLTALESRERGASGDRIPLAALDDPGERLRELVGARLARTEPALRLALETVAAAEPIPLDVADAVIELAELEELERRGLVRVDEGASPRVRTGHPLYGEVVRAGLSPLGRRQALRRVLDGAADRKLDVDALLMATWQLEAGDGADPDLLASGAWAAFHRFDNPLAERLGRQAHEQGSREGAYALVEALMGQHRADEADGVLDTLVPDDDDERARHAVARSANQFWQRGEIAGALTVLEAAEGDLTARPDLVAECRGHRSQVLFISGRFEEAEQVANEVLVDVAAPPVASLRAGMVAAPSWAAAGRVDDVVDAIDGWIRTLAATPNAVPMGDTLLRAMKFMTLAWSGRAHDAEAFAADDLGLDVEDPPAGLAAILLGVRGRAAFARGRIARAAAFLRQAVEIGRNDDWFGLQPWALAFAGRAHVFLGDFEAARAAVEEADAVSERLGRGTVNAVLAHGDIGLTRAWLAAAEGARTEAIERAQAVAAEAEAATLPVAIDALHAVVRLGGAADAVGPIGKLTRRAQGPYAPLVLRHAEAAAGGDAGELEAVAEGFERLGLDLVAMETLSAAADIHRAAGRQGSGLGCSERAAALQAACDVPPPPAIGPGAVEGAERLTDREREVALLAAHGHTSPEVAERLYISVRTVHTHLQRAYRKLGVNDREGLARAFEIRA